MNRSEGGHTENTTQSFSLFYLFYSMFSVFDVWASITKYNPINLNWLKHKCVLEKLKKLF